MPGKDDEGQKWSVTSEDSDEILNLMFEKEFGLVVGLMVMVVASKGTADMEDTGDMGNITSRPSTRCSTSSACRCPTSTAPG